MSLSKPVSSDEQIQSFGFSFQLSQCNPEPHRIVEAIAQVTLQENENLFNGYRKGDYEKPIACEIDFNVISKFYTHAANQALKKAKEEGGYTQMVVEELSGHPQNLLYKRFFLRNLIMTQEDSKVLEALECACVLNAKYFEKHYGFIRTYFLQLDHNQQPESGDFRNKFILYPRIQKIVTHDIVFARFDTRIKLI